MKKVKLTLGIIWAIISLIVIIILFPGLGGFSGMVSRLPFMKIHPRYSGGEIGFRKISMSCTLDVRKPVFKGLISDRNEGFVQLDWRGDLPEIIKDTVDYNNDGIDDFYILIDRKKTKTDLTSLNSKVENAGISAPTSYGWAVRINIKK